MIFRAQLNLLAVTHQRVAGFGLIFFTLALILGCGPTSNESPPTANLSVKTPAIPSGIEKTPLETPPSDKPLSDRPKLAKEPAREDDKSQPSSQPPNKPPVAAAASPPQFPLSQRDRQYTLGQLHKNNTTLLLVHEGDIRADYLLKKYLPFLNADQVKEAKKMIWSYDDRFVRLRRQRASILENATDDQEVERMLFENKLDIADLTSEIRDKIYREIMMPEQLQTAREFFRAENELQNKKLKR